MANAGTVGQLAAGIIAGAAIQLVGYRAAPLLFGGACVIAWLLVVIPGQLSRVDAAVPPPEAEAS